MDTSEQYIKMCDCPEIQELHRVIARTDWQNTFRGKHNTWLPRQDQIQEMFGSEVKPQYLIMSLVTFMQIQQKFYKKRNVKRLYLVGSIEQIWLAFYMYEKHKKMWDGKKWKP